MERPREEWPRRFRHIFLDAEGTLYVPKGRRSQWEFWADPSPQAALDFFELDKGANEALLQLRGRVDTLCLVSRNTRPILSAILAKYGLEDRFDDVLLNGDKGKKIEQYLAERGLRKQDSVMVGDMPDLDLYPVRRAGIEAVLVDRWYNRSARAERIGGLSELPAWLRVADIAEGMVRRRVRIASLDEFDTPPKGAGHPQASKSTGSLISNSTA